MKKVKISKSSKRDFQFFLETSLNMLDGRLDPDIVAIDNIKSTEGLSALECWNLKDTYGKIESCREPELLKKAVMGKKNWNLQIKMWAEAMADELPILRQEELSKICENYPNWIFKAVVNQARKIFFKRNGFKPFFLKNDYWQ